MVIWYILPSNLREPRPEATRLKKQEARSSHSPPEFLHGIWKVRKWPIIVEGMSLTICQKRANWVPWRISDPVYSYLNGVPQNTMFNKIPSDWNAILRVHIPVPVLRHTHTHTYIYILIIYYYITLSVYLFIDLIYLIYSYIYIYISVCLYMHKERKRERERGAAFKPRLCWGHLQLLRFQPERLQWGALTAADLFQAGIYEH